MNINEQKFFLPVSLKETAKPRKTRCVDHNVRPCTASDSCRNLQARIGRFPVFFSCRELSSINDESALVTCALSMITRDSRRKPGERLHHALEDVVGLKRGAFHRLATTTRRVILCEKIVKSVAGDRTQTVQFALADFEKSRLLCKDARYDATQRVLRGLAVSFRRYKQKELCSLSTLKSFALCFFQKLPQMII